MIMWLAVLSAMAGDAAPGVAVRETVPVTSSDFRSDEAYRALERRVSRAIRNVCGLPTASDLAGRNDARLCRKAVRDDVARQMRVQRERFGR